MTKIADKTKTREIDDLVFFLFPSIFEKR